MTDEAIVKFTVRGSALPDHVAGSLANGGLTPGGAQIVVQDLPPRALLVGRGRSWQVKTAPVTPVIAVPTTASLLSLWNGEPDGGASYVIDSVFLHQVVITAAVQNVGIMINVSGAPVTSLAGTLAPKPLRAGAAAYSGLAMVGAAVAINATDGVVGNWFPVGMTPSPSNTLQIGTTVDFPLDGLIILPPKGLLALTAIAGAATASSVQLGIRWHEVKLPAYV